MAVVVGLKFDDESLDHLEKWFKRCQESASDGPYQAFEPVARHNIQIPLGLCGSKRCDDFEPRGKLDKIIKLENPRVMFLGERGGIFLVFNSDWVTCRIEELITYHRFKRPRGQSQKQPHKPRIAISYRSNCLDQRWCRLLPIRELRVVEEIAVVSEEFDQKFPNTAHLKLQEV